MFKNINIFYFIIPYIIFEYNNASFSDRQFFNYLFLITNNFFYHHMDD